jgi:hypothetical protein
MDRTLVGTLVLAPLVLLYTGEVFYQVWLQARFLEVIPAEVRAAFPRHPKRALFSFFASLRFQFAVLRYARINLPDDTAVTTHWKRRMRASMVRESILLSCFAVSIGVLLALGWRPRCLVTECL